MLVSCVNLCDSEQKFEHISQKLLIFQTWFSPCRPLHHVCQVTPTVTDVKTDKPGCPHRQQPTLFLKWSDVCNPSPLLCYAHMIPPLTGAHIQYTLLIRAHCFFFFFLLFSFTWSLGLLLLSAAHCHISLIYAASVERIPLVHVPTCCARDVTHCSAAACDSAETTVMAWI